MSEETKNDDAYNQLLWALKELIAQWNETRRLYNTNHDMRLMAKGYVECITELEQIINGDFSPIDRI